MTFEITGLNELTTYTNVYAKVYDNAGNSDVTLAVDLTTIEAIAPPVLTILDNDTWSVSKQVQVEGVEGYEIKWTEDRNRTNKRYTKHSNRNRSTNIHNNKEWNNKGSIQKSSNRINQ